jgi:hypothetical protein
VLQKNDQTYLEIDSDAVGFMLLKEQIILNTISRLELDRLGYQLGC